MAVKQLYFTDGSYNSGASVFFDALSETSPGASAPFSPVTGWIADEVITATSYARLLADVEQAKTYSSTTWSTTTQYPVANTRPDSFQGDAFISPQYTGTFAATSWTIALLVRSVTSAYTGRFRLRWRVYKSNTANTNSGSPVWSELTSAVLLTPATTANLSTTTPLLMSVTWTPGATVTLSGEHLLFALGIEVTTTPTGTTNTQDINLFKGSTGLITTPDFTASGVTVSRSSSETVAPAESASPAKALIRSDPETMGLGESAVPARTLRQSISEGATLAEGASSAETDRRSGVETEGLTEGFSRSIGFVRSVIEALGMGESPEQASFTSRAGVETLTPAESFSLSVYELIQRSLVEQPIISESGQVAMVYRGTDAEDAGLAEVGSGASRILRSAAESVTLLEVESQALSVARAAIEAAQMLEVAEVRKDLRWSASELASPVESGAAQGAGVQAQSAVEGAQLTEEADHLLIFSRSDGEGMSVSESGVGALVVSRSQAEAAGLLEESGLAAWVRIGAGIEGLGLLESAILRGGEPLAPFAGPTTAVLIVAGATGAAPGHRGETEATVGSSETDSEVT